MLLSAREGVEMTIGKKTTGKEMKMIAKTLKGLEEVLARELRELGAKNVRVGRRMVEFSGDKEMMYRANFCLRTATRVLCPIHSFKARSADDVYREVYALPWEKYIEEGRTFAVDSVTYSEEFKNSHFVAYRVKDAIVDYFRDRTGKRPNISVTNPDVQLHIHIAETDAMLSLDSSGESLHKRGYRQSGGEAPMSEVLAAGILLLAGWKGETDLIDPMCGSGTFLVEAALIARNMAPGLFRKGYAFEKWKDFDPELLQKIYDDDEREREFHHKIYGYDNDPKAVNMSLTNVRAAGVAKDVSVKLQDFKDFTQPEERALMVVNPPYGERISSSNLLATYKMIGERLKHAFRGNTAWLISYRSEFFHQIGLRPSQRIPLMNGPLECELHKYQLFDGKLKDFRHKGGVLKQKNKYEDK